jgi:electron transfer flavoprotein alpha subunit
MLGNALETVKSKDSIKLLTIRSSAFPAFDAQKDNSVQVEEVAAGKISDKVKFVKEEVAVSDRPELSSAKRVISGGRGLKNGENFKLLYDLADKLGAAVGASRAAVDAGYVANDLQVG